jgi:hypothetical protein
MNTQAPAEGLKVHRAQKLLGNNAFAKKYVCSLFYYSWKAWISEAKEAEEKE